MSPGGNPQDPFWWKLGTGTVVTALILKTAEYFYTRKQRSASLEIQLRTYFDKQVADLTARNLDERLALRKEWDAERTDLRAECAELRSRAKFFEDEAKRWYQELLTERREHAITLLKLLDLELNHKRLKFENERMSGEMSGMDAQIIKLKSKIESLESVTAFSAAVEATPEAASQKS